VTGKGVIPTIGGAYGGLAVGDPFLIPTQFMSQMKGLQVGIILNAAVVQIDTSFTAAMPGAARTKNPPALTRRFSVMNWSAPGNGQNNGHTGTAKASRLMADTVVIKDIGLETLAMTYTAGPNQFGGTMTALLDGQGRYYVVGGLFSSQTIADLRVATLPIGNPTPGFEIKNGAGWDYTVTGNQLPGRVKRSLTGAFGRACEATPPPTPAGCNEINNFDTLGVTTQSMFGAAHTSRHMFAWTTGTVSIMRTALRGANLFRDTQTGMGYDTIGTSRFGGPQRNVGLVAGSYAVRTRVDTGETNIDIQMIGANLRFAPEPDTTVGLLSGLALLSLLSPRRRRL
jgi:hypothetical protein